MRPPANKAKLHTDTYPRTDADTDRALMTSHSTETETLRDAGPFLPQISNLVAPSVPEGQVSTILERSRRQRSELSGDRLTPYVN